MRIIQIANFYNLANFYNIQVFEFNQNYYLYGISGFKEDKNKLLSDL